MTLGAPAAAAAWEAALAGQIRARLGLELGQPGELTRRLAGAGVDAAHMDWPHLAWSPWTHPELVAVAEVVRVPETHFFRDRAVFSALAEVVLPQLLDAARERGRRLLAWSAGCSSGEEIYSIALLLHRQLLDHAAWRLDCLGTDVSATALARAAAARYGTWSFREVPGWVREYFEPAGGVVELSPAVRKRVRLEWHNLAGEAWPVLPGAADLILCRNVLMYFEPQQARRVIAALAERLRPQGVLLLGQCELGLAEGLPLRWQECAGGFFLVKETET